MKASTPYETAASRSLSALHWCLFLLNLALLLAPGFKIVQDWINLPVDFSRVMLAFPDEPEFLDTKSAHKQMRGALVFAAAVYVFGAFLCYEVFIKPKSFPTNLAAPFFIAFLCLTAESPNFFLPALDKARAIQTCENAGISWNKKKHTCDLMQLERKRLAEIKAQKKKARQLKNKRAKKRKKR